MLDQVVNISDRRYKDLGMRYQRSYPNESLIQFLASRYFALPVDERRKTPILEVGCGTGANLWMIAKEGFSAYGIDSSDTAVSLAEQHLRDKWGVKADLQVGNFHALPFKSGYFDAVVDVVSLQHLNLADSEGALTEIRRVMKSEDSWFFSYRLSDASVMFKHGGGKRIDEATLDNIIDSSMPLANNGPISFWSPALVQEIYPRVGLAVKSIERVGRTYSTSRYVEYLAVSAQAA